MLNEIVLHDKINGLKLLTSQNNWAGIDVVELAISLDAWDNAFNLICRTHKEIDSLPEPFVSPCGDGSIHINWQNDDCRIYAELHNSDILWAIKENENWSQYIGEVDSLIFDLKRLFE